MIFKAREIKKLEERLNNPNITEEEKAQITQQIEALKSKSSIPWGWVIVLAGILLIVGFSHVVSFIVNKHNELAKKHVTHSKPVHYSTSAFLIAKPKPKKQKEAYSKLNSELLLLKKKLKTNSKYIAGQVKKNTKSGVGKLKIFVNPEYAHKIKLLEGYKSPTQIAQTALKYPAGSNSYANYQKQPGQPDKNILIPDGAVVSAYTKYELYSYNSKVPVMAIVSAPYSFQGKLVIPAGYEFMGSVSGHTKSRLNIDFSQIINPESGKSIKINAIAIMPNGSAGVVGNAHYHILKNVLTGIGSGILGAAAMFAGGGSAVNSSGAYTYQDTLRQNVAQNEMQYAQNSINNSQQSANQVVITMPAKTPIKIMFLKPLTR
ncbi:MAG: TrbI/VirB10 family protein [bacterium]